MEGVRTCSRNKPISMFISYQTQSQHKAFPSRVTYLFVPRNIHEALDYPNWTLAVTEKMNTFKRNGT